MTGKARLVGPCTPNGGWGLQDVQLCHGLALQNPRTSLSRLSRLSTPRPRRRLHPLVATSSAQLPLRAPPAQPPHVDRCTTRLCGLRLRVPQTCRLHALYARDALCAGDRV